MAIDRNVYGVSWRFGASVMAAKPPTLAPTGRAVDIDGIDLYEFRDGLISRHTLIYDPVDFSQQVGLLPSLDRKVPAVMLRAQRLIASVQRRRARA